MADEALRLPKRRLVELILERVDPGLTRKQLSFQKGTSLQAALDRLTKSRLASFLFSVSPGARQAVRELEKEYPLRAAPNLYLVRVTRRPAKDELLLRKMEQLASAGHTEKLEFGDREKVREVYVAAPIRPVQGKVFVLELCFYYLRRVDFTHSDPKSRDFGKPDLLYSLEKTLLWLPDPALEHAIMCCCDFSAVHPIQAYAKSKVGLEFITPDFSLEMMKRIARGCLPRTASFTARMFSTAGPFDVKTLTLADPELASRETYKEAIADPERPQTSGFYAGYELLERSGLGIARRHGRVWTPLYLGRSELIELGLDLIARTREELKKLQTPRGQLELIRYHRHLEVRVGNAPIVASVRELFDHLLSKILQGEATRRPVALTPEFLRDFVRHKGALQFLAHIEFECQGCGVTSLATCPLCRHSLEPYLAGRQADVLADCSSHCERNRTPLRELECECGAVQDHVVVSENQFVLTPLPPLEKAITDASTMIFTNGFQGAFQIAQGELTAFRSKGDKNFYGLGLRDLQRWAVVPSFQNNLEKQPWDATRKGLLLRILARTKEKCTREVRDLRGHVWPEGSRSSRDKCDCCLSQVLPVNLLREGKLCLGRVFGIPIGEKLDGVHHQWEVADVRYQDSCLVGQPEIRLAIHLKSRATDRPEGLGRSSRAIKELYTQLFHLAYRVKSGKQINVDVVGVSIPNRLKEDVRETLKNLAARLGLQILILEENDWLAIVDAADRTLQPAPQTKYPGPALQPRGRKPRDKT